ncbi:F0F1 ATP synthase subunit delta [Clostridioides difficile]|uniref:F0F1 ATP synthase subunit delta n=1 Tax=Clostridioides difficile TaxID=1496 RepID=UPI000BB1C5D4|nr:F0F1 ATP synthase subunit delta [Clostridioides difficile]EGT2205036.1 F0F1 ATP synthase subunit delta [Clostridioides difficile]PBE20561.1 ATP synthase F1 subunit delta [Clostridioides difficile]HAT4769163.1 F0F1 ATP synthase subunit delta [Clostridioides difficile]HAT4772630.1 F0F1 ATP synthase subunit delta [Clostridioides difficile]HAT4799293.1 F0F1 ATP synthase subunit delta [Clostridioides difficile]
MINVIANRYAEALFQLGEEENSTDVLFKELEKVVDMMTKVSKDFYKVLKSPLVSKSEKKNLVEIIFSKEVSSNIKNFLKVLVDKDRISYLEDIELAYKELLNKKNNVIDGVAISAIPMSEIDIKELEVKLSNKYNKNVTIENVVDKTILGGVLVRIGNEQIDGTVKTRLDKMKEKLSEVIS